jgi:hypothetical protein
MGALSAFQLPPKKLIHYFMYLFTQPHVKFLHNGRKFITTFKEKCRKFWFCSVYDDQPGATAMQAADIPCPRETTLVATL